MSFATDNQISYIKSLIKKGRIADSSFDGLVRAIGHHHPIKQSKALLLIESLKDDSVQSSRRDRFNKIEENAEKAVNYFERMRELKISIERKDFSF